MSHENYSLWQELQERAHLVLIFVRLHWSNRIPQIGVVSLHDIGLGMVWPCPAMITHYHNNYNVATGADAQWVSHVSKRNHLYSTKLSCGLLFGRPLLHQSAPKTQSVCITRLQLLYNLISLEFSLFQSNLRNILCKSLSPFCETKQPYLCRVF